MKFKNKVALITGATRGIGKEIAIELAKEGCNLIINYKESEDLAEKLKEELEETYNIKVLTLQADMSNEQDINNMVNKSLETFKTIDILVNNAAIAIDTTIEDKTKENFMKILETNLVGPFILSRLVGNHMMKQKQGKIINIASTNGIDTYYPESLDYDASKAGLISLTHNLAYYFKPYINVNAIAPGWVRTDMNKNLDEEFIDNENKKIFLNRFANPNEIAKVALFLASDDASYINNEVIRVDGGSFHE